MDLEFWEKVWAEGRINFHKESYNEKLVTFFPLLKPTSGQLVLVPLCGKSKDLLWLHEHNLQVHGVEFHGPAVKSFFEENSLSPVEVNPDPNFIHYSHKNITISNGDFLKLDKIETYDFIYDRASLVALPLEMRKNYSEIIKRALKRGGKCLLVVYEYDQSKIDGPPFSVDDKEIHELYDEHFSIQLIETHSPNVQSSRFSSVECNLKEKTYILEKNKSLLK